MKKYKSLLMICSILLIIFQACEQDTHSPINQDDEIPPVIINPTIENLPGGALIRYDLPVEKKGLLYVKAECEIQPGVKREVKASYYTTNLIVDGFGNTNEYEVRLYSVGRNGKVSEPVKVKVNPLTPPIWETFNSLVVEETWGGISFTFHNEYEANIVFEIITIDSLGNWVPAENFYTKMKEAKFALRGYKPEPQVFGISIRDRWLNRTDTLIGEYTPWYEEMLDKSKFKNLKLPTDYYVTHTGVPFEGMWDNVYPLQAPGGGYVSKPDLDGSLGGGMPQWFTIDLGVTARLSRYKLFIRTSSAYLYNSGAPKKWEIWGSNDPNPDGSWDDSWTLLMECESKKPSGLPTGQNTSEDLEYALAGDEFEFEDVPPVRYLRWKFFSNWSGSTHVNIVEFDFYGQVIN